MSRQSDVENLAGFKEKQLAEEKTAEWQKDMTEVQVTDIRKYCFLIILCKVIFNYVS